jgi:hypothetical protein
MSAMWSLRAQQEELSVVNNSSTPVNASNVGVSYDRGLTKQFVVGVVLEDLFTRGPITQAMGP